MKTRILFLSAMFLSLLFTSSPAFALTTSTTYAAVSCGRNGAALLTAGGETETIPLTVGWFGVTGLYNPPLEEQQAENSVTFEPTSTFPVYIRQGAAWTDRVFVYPPGNWPVTVIESATITPPSGAVNPETGNLLLPETWQTAATEVANHLYVAGFVLPAVYPNGSEVSTAVTATDACGSQTDAISNVLQVAGRPNWDFTVISTP